MSKLNHKALFIILITSVLALGYSSKQDESHITGSESGGATNEERFSGEYGLYVAKKGEKFEVRWITTREDSGYFKAYFQGSLVSEVRTAAAKTHVANFKNLGTGQYTLEYGGLADQEDRHSTTINPTIDEKLLPSTFSKVDSIYVFGDVHGKYREVVKLLSNTGLIDEEGHWTGGQTHLVFLGDLFDRGPDVTKLLWFLYRLEKEAQEQNGYLHIILGNHEIMTFTNDLRYTSEKEIAIANYYGLAYSRMFDVKESVLGSWLASKPGIIKINDMLFSHAGIIVKYPSIEAFNDSLFRYVHEPVFTRLMDDNIDSTEFSNELLMNRRGFFFSGENPFWFRGYVWSDTLDLYLDYVNNIYDARMQVVGHTPVKTICEFYDGKLIATDLEDAASEMLLIVRYKRKKYLYFKIDLEGKVSEL